MRIFATCENAQSAHEISTAITDCLRDFSPEVFSEAKQYWKIPSFFEFTFTVSPANQETFRLIIASCENGWLHMSNENDTSSVWNRSENSTFLLPDIEWAEVSLHA
jgi:hypothetical protein